MHATNFGQGWPKFKQNVFSWVEHVSGSIFGVISEI